MNKFMGRILLSALLIGIFSATVVQAEQLTPKLCKQKVMEAATLLETEGDAAIAKIKDPKGSFRFADGSGYIWIHNLEGKMIMHPIKSTLDGQDILGTSDPDGTYLFVAMNEIVEEHGAGWVPYKWPKPGKKDASQKVSFVKLIKHAGKSYVAGAGMYDVQPADIKKEFPGDAVYE